MVRCTIFYAERQDEMEEVHLTREDMLALCCAAFGKGSQTYDVSDAAVHSMVSHYLAHLQERQDSWPRIRQATLKNAEELGRICARLKPEGPILERDFEAALDELKRLWGEGFPGCPI